MLSRPKSALSDTSHRYLKSLNENMEAKGEGSKNKKATQELNEEEQR